MKNTFSPFIKPLLGQTCQKAERGLSAFLTFDFGKKTLSDAGLEKFEWHLWIYCCHWQLRKNNTIIATCEDPYESISEAITCIKNQKITDIKITDKQSTLFSFSQEYSLETQPFDPSSVQWLLYSPHGTLEFTNQEVWNITP